MSTVEKHYRFEGPYGRYHRACFDLNRPKEAQSPDLWVQRIVDILKLRAIYDKQSNGRDSFMQDFPVLFNLMATFESDTTGSDKELLEACLLATSNCGDIEEFLAIPRFTRIFISAYREMFYNIEPIRKNEALFNRYVMLPMLQADTDKVAVGTVWKLLACSGGLPLLKEKGLKSAAIRPEDISYLLQLSCLRNCTMLLKYAAGGLSMIDEHPNAMIVFSQLAEFDGLRAPDRRPDGFQVTTGVSRNLYNDMLSQGIKLISAPKEIAEELLRADGTFHPELSVAAESNKHNNLSDTESRGTNE